MREHDTSTVFGGMALNAASTSSHSYPAIVNALLHRLRGGSGAHTDMSPLEPMFSYYKMNARVYTA